MRTQCTRPKQNAPFSKDLFFLGRYGFKEFYLSHTLVTQTEAAARCKLSDMNLAVFLTQKSLDFVGNLTDMDLCWTDGVLVNAATSYKWLYSEDYLSDEFAFEEGTHIGLRLLKGKGTSSLTPGGSMQSHCYICYKWLANENP
ncbi:uncharacterized protein LOC118434076 [Folsomia candida]|uniref:uncharacterized protein LOC118434076 n=1 Tax=Folsomia candida TaxID=158441 RepID=UPI001604E8F9|nr:uncharacterized protein LOC118434076 [Folsomia candida]